LLAIVINMFAPVLSARYFNRTLASRGEQFSASPALAERFGQFTIIVLAESILSIVSGFSMVNARSLIVWCIFLPVYQYRLSALEHLFRYDK